MRLAFPLNFKTLRFIKSVFDKTSCMEEKVVKLEKTYHRGIQIHCALLDNVPYWIIKQAIVLSLLFLNMLLL